MSKIIIDYLKTTGEILACSIVPDVSWAGDPIEGCAQLEVAERPDSAAHYILNGAIETRKPFTFEITKTQITADGIDTITITNIPKNTTITWWDDQQDIITDGILEITSDLAGDYKIILDHPHYLQETLNFEARN